MTDVAALYVSRKGPYWGRPDVDAWDEERDARLYTGPHPVVAHPPCQLWTNMAGVNFRRYGGPHNRPGNDGGCFMRALECVRAFGGVLEHPAGSLAWATFALRAPDGIGWQQCGPREWSARSGNPPTGTGRGSARGSCTAGTRHPPSSIGGACLARTRSGGSIASARR